jgi:SAM-dependent methyltransferase
MLTATDLRDRAPAVLRSACGRTIALDVARWVDEVSPEDERLLDDAVGPVLDVGCGPGRMVTALQRRGITVLGIDRNPEAIAAARARGATVRRADVFGPVPDEGRWASALLLDGNVGIGGDPEALLRRLRQVLRPRGRLLVELEPPDTGTARLMVRAEVGAEPRTDWFPWAVVAVDAVEGLAADAGFAVHATWEGGGRWFASLDAR